MVEKLARSLKKNNTTASYSKTSKTFHWLLALLILTMLGVGLYMANLPNTSEKWTFYALHKATGVVVLVLVTLRLLWRWSSIVPDLPQDFPAWQHRAAQVTHFLLYVLMFAGPISGMLMSLLGGHAIAFYGLFTIPALYPKGSWISGLSHTVHTQLIYLWVALLGLHIVAALYHHFIRKDDILKRMV